MKRIHGNADGTTLPHHLLPLELEREMLAGGFQAIDLQNGDPRHDAARRALEIIAHFDVGDLWLREHQEVLMAMQRVLTEFGTLSPALVLDELHRGRHRDAARLLPDLASYGLAPVVGLPAHAHRIRDAARRRREFHAHRDAASRLYAGGA